MTLSIHPSVQNLEDEIVATRRDIHKHPELSFKEFRTAKLVSERLQSLGIEVREQVGKTGVVGTLCGGKEGPTVALRADMDALPMQETSDVPYASIHEGVMHACGHDGHTAMLLGAAKVLSDKREQIAGNVKFIFQPAEEGYAGAKYMVADGALEGVDEIYGIHLWNYQKFGTVGVKPGPIMAASDKFTIDIQGIGGHGACPQGTVDPIVVAAHLITALQTIVSRNTNPLESTVVTVGMMEGGTNFNIIPHHATLKGTARAYTEDNRNLIKKRMAEITAGVGATYGAKITLDYQDGYPPTINADEQAQVLLEAAQKIVGDTEAGYPYLSMGGEDFSYFAQEVPACYFLVGSAPLDREPMSVPHHCSHFDIDERALLVGASVFVQVIEDRL
ncbi:MAG: amidohydrolase [Deltaproteobacteria bacterium]|jgi:amidohydrolase|nr:amidohydrolase [Deltaproteobacteria bacterium]MBT6431618.1 amidohydrolase [Deltaproteobacteria bacterium]